jgi:peptidoglycan/LPS O-acetylase OafA/YrhL
MGDSAGPVLSPSPRAPRAAGEPRHFAYIDALRGYAFLGVLCVHATLACGRFPGSNLTAQGGLGVQLFFLASAITLCFSMSSRREGRTEYLNFYLRRLFRIAPLFWLAMIVYWIVPGALPHGWWSDWAPNGVTASYFILTALFLHGWHPYTFNSIVPGGWSIAVEMTFYVVFPFCFHAIGTVRRAAVWLLAGVALTVLGRFAIGYAAPWLWPGVGDTGILAFFREYWFPSQFVVFLIGIFTYYLLREPAIQALARSRFWAGWLLVVSLTVFGSFLNHGVEGYLQPILVVMVLAAPIVALSGHRVPLAVNPLICLIGKLSYSCYLTHFAAIAIIMRFLPALIGSPAVPGSGETAKIDLGSGAANLGVFALVFGSTLALTLVFSTATYHLVEKPGIALGRSLIRKIDGQIKR